MPSPRTSALGSHAANNLATGQMVINPDGSVSTLRSGSVNDPRLNSGLPTLVPHVWNGQVVDSDTAARLAVESGQQWPAYGTHDYATLVSKNLSNTLPTERPNPYAIAPGSLAAGQMSHGFSGTGGIDPRVVANMNPTPQQQWERERVANRAAQDNAYQGGQGWTGAEGGVPYSDLRARVESQVGDEQRNAAGWLALDLLDPATAGGISGLKGALALGAGAGSLATMMGRRVDPSRMSALARAFPKQRGSLGDIGLTGQQSIAQLPDHIKNPNAPIAVPRGALARDVLEGTDPDMVGPTLPHGLDLPPLQRKRRNVAQVQASVEALAREGHGAILEETSENLPTFAKMIAEDAKTAMSRTGHAGNWYNEKIYETHRLARLEFPELADNEGKSAMFDAAFAIASNGMDIPTNTKLGRAQFAAYLKTGKFPITGQGAAAGEMQTHYSKLNKLIEELGEEDAARFLNTPMSGADAARFGFDSGVSSERATYGSSVFGPKIGGAFYQNLRGNMDPLTKDRWNMRTWGRYKGQLFDRGETVQNNAARFARLAQSPAGRRVLAEKLRMAPEDIEGITMDDWIDVARKTYQRWGQHGSTDVVDWTLDKPKGKGFPYTGDPEMDEVLKKARAVAQKGGQSIDAPGGPAQRAYMDDAYAMARQMLADEGIETTPGDLQALVWYLEKDYYSALGATSKKSAPTDFAEQYAGLLQGKKGISNADIETARATVPGGNRPSSARLEGGAARAVDRYATLRTFDGNQVGGSDRPLSGRIRAYQRGGSGKRGHVTLPMQDGTTYRVPSTPHSMTRAASNRLKAIGVTPTPYQEMDVGAQAGEAFHAAMTRSLSGHPGAGSVHIYSPEEYASMRTFVSDDGSTGFALKGEDIVSVFNSPEGPNKGASVSAIRLAVENGGRTLDGFDTVLGELYSQNGFRVVARTKFDPAVYAEQYGDEALAAFQQQNAKFNNGAPDIIFMVYDPSRPKLYKARKDASGVYTRGDDLPLSSYDEALAVQQREKKSAARRYSVEPSIKKQITSARRRGALAPPPPGALQASP